MTMAPLAATPIPSTITTGPTSMSKADEFKIINDVFFQYMDMKPKPWAIVISVGLCLGWCLSGIVFFQVSRQRPKRLCDMSTSLTTVKYWLSGLDVCPNM